MRFKNALHLIRLTIYLIIVMNDSLILMYWENNTGQLKKYKRLYKLLSIQDKLVIIKLFHRPTKFRSTLIKSYFQDSISINDN